LGQCLTSRKFGTNKSHLYSVLIRLQSSNSGPLESHRIPEYAELALGAIIL
jgi:hypothetical protein